MLAAVPRLTGTAFNVVLQPHPDQSQLALVALVILACVLVGGVFDMTARFSSEILAQRLERDSRDELYLSLLGKSQTFHNRQQVGDIMARATNDVRQLNPMINPGIDLIFDSLLNLVVPDGLHRVSLAAAAARAAALHRRLLLRHPRLHPAAQSRLERDAAAVRHDERRAGGDDHRHRGGQVHRAGAAGARQVWPPARAATATTSSATGRFRRGTCRR